MRTAAISFHGRHIDRLGRVFTGAARGGGRRLRALLAWLLTRSWPLTGRGAGGQRGYAILSLAMVGLTGAAVLAIPVLQRANTVMHLQRNTSVVNVNGAAAAAEHALWRIAHDSGFVPSLTGEPPCGDYTLAFPDGPATVEVCASSGEPVGHGLSAFLSVSPNLLLPNMPTTVTYTMRVVNDSSAPQTIIRVEADPQSGWKPSCATFPLSGSTQGYTPEDPSYTDDPYCPPNAGHARRWDGIDTVVPGFGGEAVMQWQAEVTEGAGTYSIRGKARVQGIGDIAATVTNIRVTGVEGLDIETVVTPTEVTSGPGHIFEYTITVINGGTETLHINRMRHDVPRAFGHLSGSTGGITFADPHPSSNGACEFCDWTWNFSPGVTLVPHEPRVLTFQMTADLDPGTYYASSSVRVDEDGAGGGQNQTADTGETAPVNVIRSYTINAAHNGHTVDVEAYLRHSGIEVTSWEE